MSGKRRIVTIPVDDERTDFLAVYECRGGPMPGEQSELLRSFDVPVPSDDQLTRDIEDAVHALLYEAAETRKAAINEPNEAKRQYVYYATADGLEASATRLRSHFRLDDEGSE